MSTITHHAPLQGVPAEEGQPAATCRFAVELSPAAVQQVLLAHLLTARLGDALASRLDLTVRRDALAFNARRAYVATGSYDGVEISFIPHGKGARLWEVGVGVGGERTHPGTSTLVAADRLPMYVDELIERISHRLHNVRQKLSGQAAARAVMYAASGTKGQPKQGDNGCEAHQCRGLRRAALNRR